MNIKTAKLAGKDVLQVSGRDGYLLICIQMKTHVQVFVWDTMSGESHVLPVAPSIRAFKACVDEYGHVSREIDFLISRDKSTAMIFSELQEEVASSTSLLCTRLSLITGQVLSEQQHPLEGCSMGRAKATPTGYHDLYRVFHWFTTMEREDDLGHERCGIAIYDEDSGRVSVGKQPFSYS